MKRITSILLILIIACSVFTVMSIPAFAEDGAVAGDEATAGEGAAAGALDGILAKLKQFVAGVQLDNIKETVFGPVKNMWNLIMSNETYKNFLTGILAVLAFIAIPVVFGVTFIVYAIMVAASVLGNALIVIIVAITEMLIGVLMI